MLRGFLTFVRYELLMLAKSWRLWLCLAVLIAAPWLLAAEAGDGQGAASPAVFSDFVYGGSLLVGLVVVILTVDTMARVRATGVQSVLFTKPFSTLTFVTASWAAVVLLAVVLAGASLVARHLLARHSLGLQVHLGALGWLVGLDALPGAVTLVALVIWIRTVFKHNFSAYLASGAAAVGLFAAANVYDLPLLGWSQELRAPLAEYYMPAIGRDIDWSAYGLAFLNSLLVGLFFLALTCYHIRRQEPQRKVLGSYGKRWTDMPTFVRFFFDLKIDRRVGPEVHVLLAGTLLVAGFVATRTITHAQARTRQQQDWATQLRRDLRENGPAVPGLWLRHYAGRLEIERRGCVRSDLRMDVMNTTPTAVDRIAVEIPFGVEIERFDGAGGRPLDRRRWGNIVVARLDRPLTAGSTTTVRVAYAGRPRALEIGGLVPYTERYAVTEASLDTKGVSLGSKYQRIDVWLLPRTVILEQRADGIYPVEMPRLFTADLEFDTFSDLRAVSPDGPVVPLDPDDATGAARLRIDWPQNDLTLLAGPYEAVERTFGPAPFCLFAFRKDRDVVEFLLQEYAETFERWATILGPPPGPCYALVQTLHPHSTPDALPSATLYTPEIDQLRRAIPLYRERETEGFRALYSFRTTLRSTLAGTMLRETFHAAREIEPLKTALYFYLLRNVHYSELGPTARRSIRLFRRVGTEGGGRGGFLDPVRRAAFDRPLVERLADPTLQGHRFRYVWQLFHFLLEDEKFAVFLRTLMTEFEDRLVNLEDLEAVAERIYGESLDWFFDHWFFGTGVPEYKIATARATMVENPRTRDIEYDVEIVVTNEGRGRMPVPVVLQTEGDNITRQLWLDTAGSATLALRVPDRPEFTWVDPEGWIPQVGTRQNESGERGPAQRKVRIVE